MCKTVSLYRTASYVTIHSDSVSHHSVSPKFLEECYPFENLKSCVIYLFVLRFVIVSHRLISGCVENIKKCTGQNHFPTNVCVGVWGVGGVVLCVFYAPASSNKVIKKE